MPLTLLDNSTHLIRSQHQRSDDDVSLEREQITFRPNAWRRLKTLTSHRSVPLWSQLKEILRPWVAERRLSGGRLLFPSYRTGQEAMLTDCRKLLDTVSARAKFAAREVNLYDFRHIYCAARLQRLDGDALVSPYTVGQELGHGSGHDEAPATAQSVTGASFGWYGPG